MVSREQTQDVTYNQNPSINSVPEKILPLRTDLGRIYFWSLWVLPAADRRHLCRNPLDTGALRTGLTEDLDDMRRFHELHACDEVRLQHRSEDC